MKVSADKLAARLQKQIDPVYIVSGDEPLLVQESCDMIRRELRAAGYTERQVFHVAPKFDWQEVLFNANSMSLFAEQKLLEIRSTGKPDKEAVAALQTFIEDIPAGTAMLLVWPKVEKKTESTAWFKAVDKVAVHVPIWPVGVDELPRWIGARFQRAGLRASDDAVRAMVERIEGNLLAAAQEIERLKLIVDDDFVDVEHVLDGVGDSARYSVYNLIDAAVGQDAARTLRVVQGVRVEGLALPLISFWLAKELRTLVGVSAAVARGQKVEAAMQKVYVFANRRAIVARCVRARSLGQLEKLQAQAGKLDKLAKGIGQGDSWDLLTSIVLELAGRPVIKTQGTAG